VVANDRPPLQRGEGRGEDAMRRIILMLMVSALLAGMLAFASPASAQGGCKAFGQSVAEDAKEFRPLGQNFVRGHAPLNDEAHTEHAQFCG
jgi:hypothetical protein